MLINKRTGQTRAGYARCAGGCGGWSSCSCDPRKSAAEAKRAKEDQQDREADAYLRAHGRPAQGFKNKSGRLK